MPRDAPPGAWIRIFLPFALGYYLSYLLRTVNAVISPDLTRELGLSAADLAHFDRPWELFFESEPTWTTLRQLLRDQVSLQSLIGSTVAAAASILGVAIVVLLYVTFLLIEQRAFAAKVDRLSSDPRSAALIRQIVADVNARVGSYLALKTLLGMLQAVVSWVVMWWFGLEFATFWAMLVVLLNYIPYIGSFLSVFFPVAMAIVQFGDPNTIVTLAIALVVVQFAIGNFLDPYLLGNSLNLSPAAILVSLSVWSGLWGLPGAFLAVPITAVMAIVFSEFAATRPIAVLLSRNGTPVSYTHLTLPTSDLV